MDPNKWTIINDLLLPFGLAASHTWTPQAVLEKFKLS